MKTTLDIPDPLFREAKMVAARDGTTLRAVVTQALQKELQRRRAPTSPTRLPASFGGLRRLREESARVQGDIEKTFGDVDESLWE